MRNGSEKLLVRVDARAAELEDHRMRLRSPDDSSNCFRNIFHIGRLQSGPAAAEHRIDWKLAKELEDAGEKRVVRSEHHSRADEKCIGERGPDRQFAFAALDPYERADITSNTYYDWLMTDGAGVFIAAPPVVLATFKEYPPSQR